MPSAGSDLVIETQRDDILYISLNRPDKLNALIDPMRDRLLEIARALMSREEIRVCVITGEGRAFCAGGDIKVMADIIKSQQYDRMQKILQKAGSIVLALRELPIPVIAAVNGHAFGSGMNLALACDIRLVSSEATFGETFINIGLHPDWGGTHLLPGIINVSRALEMFWTGRVISADEAMRAGIANMVFAPDVFYEKVHAYARNLAQKPKLAVRLAKKAVYEDLNNALADAMHREEEAQIKCLATEEARQKIESFLSKNISSID